MSNCINISSQEFVKIAQLTHLKKLNVSSITFDDSAFTHLKSLLNLKILDISQTNISSLMPLNYFSLLEALNISRCEHLQDDSFSQMAVLENLKKLEYSSVSLDLLKKMPHLEMLVLSPSPHYFTESNLNIILEMKHLKKNHFFLLLLFSFIRTLSNIKVGIIAKG